MIKYLIIACIATYWALGGFTTGFEHTMCKIKPSCNAVSITRVWNSEKNMFETK